MQGCDGERVYYDGCPLIALNGNVLAQGSQFSLQDVQVISANIDIQDVESYRSGFISRNFQAASAPIYPQILLETSHVPKSPNSLSYPIDPVIYSPSEEIEYGPACWLWDYLRRSKSGGFFLPLSGGLDSCSTALIVFSMARLVYEEFQKPKNLQDQTVIEDLRTIVNDPQFTPKSPAEICNLIFHTCYMKTSNSSTETEQRAFSLSKSIGSYHLSFNIDNIISAIVQVFQLATGLVPKFKVFGGSVTENLALQNIQARSRMVVSYFFAQLLLWTRGNPRSLLVLSSANVDETLRGYFTKYDCSSGDINPIGGISKTDLKQFVKHMSTKIDGLSAFLNATPTAELEPLTSTYSQSDEVDMEMTYEELSIFGNLRKVHKMGPYSMFKRLLIEWRHLEPKTVAQKVKKFFFYYSINRHKTTILPPSYHMSLYSPDDNRFDLRQFLYNAAWTWQFQKIDDHVSKL
jgi:NAD+ synthase (glutamine-hydrolysing)